MRQKLVAYEFAKACFKYNLPHDINNTSKIVIEKIGTHSLRGVANYAKQIFMTKI